MVTDPADIPARAILHVGAPKCGSSALQRALSAHPVMTGTDGRPYRYLAARLSGGRIAPVQGRRLCAMAGCSVHGYAAWPNITRDDDPDAYWPAVAGAMAGALRHGRVPILSSEGWIAHASAAPVLLRDTGLEVLDVAAYVRPPLDWLNAAWWQWVVWHMGRFRLPEVERWLTRVRFDPALQLAGWAAAPGVRLRVESAGGDVVGRFAQCYGLPLAAGGRVNAAPPAALTGFLLRNRRFRPTAHDSATEFVVQRWCRFAPGVRLWAFQPRFATAVWPRLRQEAQVLLDALPPEMAARLSAEPGWSSLDPYWARLKAGPTRLDDTEALADLYDGIAAGVLTASRAARWHADPGPAKPTTTAPIETWDTAIAGQLDRLLEADVRWRRPRGYRAIRLLLGETWGSRLPRFR